MENEEKKKRNKDESISVSVSGEITSETTVHNSQSNREESCH